MKQKQPRRGCRWLLSSGSTAALVRSLPWGCMIPRSHGVSSRRRQPFRRPGAWKQLRLETSRGREPHFVFEWRLDSGRLLSIGPWNLWLVGPVLLAGDGEVAWARDAGPTGGTTVLVGTARAGGLGLLLRDPANGSVWGFASRRRWPGGTCQGLRPRTEYKRPSRDRPAAAVEAVARRTGLRGDGESRGGARRTPSPRHEPR